MENKNPPFEITNGMIDEIAAIAELVGRITSTHGLSANPNILVEKYTKSFGLSRKEK